MVETFGLLRTPKIHCGTGEISRLPAFIKNRCSRVLMLTGSKSFTKNKAVLRNLLGGPGKRESQPWILSGSVTNLHRKILTGL